MDGLSSALRRGLGAALMLCNLWAGAAGPSDAQRFSIGPSDAELRLGQSLTLQVHRDDCAPRDKGCLQPLPIEGNARVLRWRVNGVDGGSDSTGRIVRQADGTAIYTAPRGLPPVNPVAVSAVVSGAGKSQVTLVSEVRIVDAKPWSGHLQMEVNEPLSWSAPGGHQYEGWLRYTVRQPVAAVVTESSEDDGTRFVTLQLGDPEVQTLDHQLKHQPPPGDPCRTTEYDVLRLHATPALKGAGALWMLHVDRDGRVSTSFLPQPPLQLAGQHDFVIEGCATRTTSQPIAPQRVAFDGFVGKFVGSQLEADSGSQASFVLPSTINLQGVPLNVTVRLNWHLRRRL